MAKKIEEKGKNTYLEALFDWDEESMIAISSEERFFLGKHHALIKASDTMWSNIEGISVSEEIQGVGVIDLVGAAITGREGNQNIIDDVKNLKREFIH